MKRMEIKGIDRAFITLHVGLGNFRTVDVEDLSKHKMDSEQFFVTEEAAGTVNEAKRNGHKVAAIGTTVMRPLEAELTKYMHNVFGAYKVTYFNACREYCEQMGADWRKVHTGVLLSGYINDTHTYVPGPDGKFGYGGKCFPKDVNAFAKMTAGTSLGTLLAHLHELNVHFRGVEERI